MADGGCRVAVSLVGWVGNERTRGRGRMVICRPLGAYLPEFQRCCHVAIDLSEARSSSAWSEQGGGGGGRVAGEGWARGCGRER